MSGRGAYYKALYGSGGRRRGGGEGGGRGSRRGGAAAFNPRPFTAESSSMGGGGSSDRDAVDYYSASFHEQQQQQQHDFSNAAAAPAAAGRTEAVRRRGGSLHEELLRLEGRPYGAYNDLLGVWKVDTFQLFVDKVQSDPFAPPSKFRVRLPQRVAEFPPHLFREGIRNVALCDYLTRRFAEAVQHGGLHEAAQHGGRWGSSKGGDIHIDVPGQHVLQRTTFVISEEAVEARCTIALPARGRSIEGRRAAERLCEQLPAVVRQAMYYRSLNPHDVEAHVLSIEDQEYLRRQLPKMNLAAFVINGASLPRASGSDDRPLTKQQAPELVLFKSPPSLEVAIELPNRGVVRGMGIPRGITLIVGGGFHGKTTLLEALQWGIYNKVPGDGREFVVVEPAAVKIRAEDGRSVVSVDISPFINNLPFGKQTTRFSCADASGSTSQAANIMEALELGATTLLVDEDTCATNFMIRDRRMQALVAKDKEPITPFVHKIGPLWRQHGVGTIMVVGGSGDFFDVADNVIMMDCYQAICVTQQAKNISQMFRAEYSSAEKETARDQDASQIFGDIGCRVIGEGCLSQNGKVKVGGTWTISYGYTEIDLSCVEQLAETSQTRAISRCLQRLAESTGGQILDGRRTLPEILAAVWSIITSSSASGTGYNGLDALSPFADPMGDLALPRKMEIGFVINRLRTLRVNDVVRRGLRDKI